MTQNFNSIVFSDIGPKRDDKSEKNNKLIFSEPRKSALRKRNNHADQGKRWSKSYKETEIFEKMKFFL